MDAADFESRLRAAAKDLKRCTSYNELRTVWERYYNDLGHRALGRLVLGRSIDELVERRREKGE